MALGSGTTTAWQMARAYAVFANRGYLIQPYFIHRIVDDRGNLLGVARPQRAGDETLRVIDEGKVQDIPIQEGEIFLLPPNVPHSPQRPAGTVGLVLERRRQPKELDGFMWLCPKCGEKLYEEFVHVTNLVTQLPPIFEHFYGNPENCTCKKCGTQVTKGGGKA